MKIITWMILVCNALGALACIYNTFAKSEVSERVVSFVATAISIATIKICITLLSLM